MWIFLPNLAQNVMVSLNRCRTESFMTTKRQTNKQTNTQTQSHKQETYATKINTSSAVSDAAGRPHRRTLEKVRRIIDTNIMV